MGRQVTRKQFRRREREAKKARRLAAQRAGRRRGDGQHLPVHPSKEDKTGAVRSIVWRYRSFCGSA